MTIHFVTSGDMKNLKMPCVSSSLGLVKANLKAGLEIRRAEEGDQTEIKKRSTYHGSKNRIQSSLWRPF